MKKNSTLLLVACLIGVGWALFSDYSSYLLDPVNNRFDASIFYYMGTMLKEGMIPYVDLWDHKGIALFLINYLAAYVPLGVIELVEIAILISTSYFIARRFITDRLLAALPLVLLLPSLYNVASHGNTSECHSLTFSVMALALYLSSLGEKSLKKIGLYSGLAAICFVVTVLIRANNTAVWCAFAFFYTGWCLYHRKWREYLSTAVGTIFGVVVGIIPFALYLHYTNSFDEFWYASWTYNFTYSASRNVGLVSTYLYLSKFFYKSLAPVLFALFCYSQKDSMQRIADNGRAVVRGKSKLKALGSFYKGFGWKEHAILLGGLVLIVSLLSHPPLVLAVIVNLAIIAFAVKHRDNELVFIFCLWIVSAIFMSVSGRHYRYYAAGLYLPSLLLISYYIEKLAPHIEKYRTKLIGVATVVLFAFVIADGVLPEKVGRHVKRQVYLQDAWAVMEKNCDKSICTVAAPVYPDLYTAKFRPATPYMYYAPVGNVEALVNDLWRIMQETPPDFMFFPGKTRIGEEEQFKAKATELGLMECYEPVGSGVFRRMDTGICGEAK